MATGLRRARRRLLPVVTIFLGLLCPLAAPAADPAPEIFPLDQIKPGMRAQVRTIFAGKDIEELELEVIGVLRNFIGPGQDMILVRLLGEKANYTGIVAGMSGSPVYIDGKLVGALAFKIGSFTREPIGGVTPFRNMLRASETQSASTPATGVASYPLPAETVQSLGMAGSETRYLTPIETPITFVGIHPEVVRRFSPEFTQLGLAASQGGGTALPENTSALEPGGAVAAAMVTGDMSIAATCTITARIEDQLYACGHWLLSYGNVAIPMARVEVVTTVASELNSFKVSNVGELVGTFTQDRRSAIVGTLGPVPDMVPVDLSITHAGKQFDYHYRIFQHPKISPTLLNTTLFNGLFSTIEAGEGFTYRVKGKVQVKDHADIVLDDMFGPTDGFLPDAARVAGDATGAFRRVYGNPFETPTIERISLEVELLPERLTATMENAWVDKREARPGETVTIKAVLQPYRGERIVREISVVIPPQATRGRLRILVSDATALNFVTRTMAGGGRLLGRLGGGPRISNLDQLIALLNRERRNDRLYVTLFQRTPTVLVEDKVLPSIPLSQLNVLTRQQVRGSTRVFFESILKETSEPLNQVLRGSRWLQVTIR